MYNMENPIYNKLTLTPEGEIFYKSAEELLAHADSVESKFHELRKKVTPIRIGIPPMLGTIYLPELHLSMEGCSALTIAISSFSSRTRLHALIEPNSLKISEKRT